jgi:tripartite-type tricarboxylate transporter receptor subunit TctC
MSPEIKEQIAADVRAVATNPVVGTRVAGMGAVLRTGTSAEFSAAIEEQRVRISEIARTMKPKR